MTPCVLAPRWCILHVWSYRVSWQTFASAKHVGLMACHILCLNRMEIFLEVMWQRNLLLALKWLKIRTISNCFLRINLGCCPHQFLNTTYCCKFGGTMSWPSATVNGHIPHHLVCLRKGQDGFGRPTKPCALLSCRRRPLGSFVVGCLPVEWYGYGWYLVLIIWMMGMMLMIYGGIWWYMVK